MEKWILPNCLCCCSRTFSIFAFFVLVVVGLGWVRDPQSIYFCWVCGKAYQLPVTGRKQRHGSLQLQKSQHVQGTVRVCAWCGRKWEMSMRRRGGWGWQREHFQALEERSFSCLFTIWPRAHFFHRFHSFWRHACRGACVGHGGGVHVGGETMVCYCTAKGYLRAVMCHKEASIPKQKTNFISCQIWLDLFCRLSGSIKGSGHPILGTSSLPLPYDLIIL